MLSIIVAVDQNNLLGKDNELPWKLPSDMAYFKSITANKTVVMGRRTYESIGKPLPNRHNIILTRQKNYKAPNDTDNKVVVTDNFNLLLFLGQESKTEEIMIIGGVETYKQFYPYVNRIYLTQIWYEFKGNQYLPFTDPIINSEEWELISKTSGVVNSYNPYQHDFLVFDRRS